MANYHFTVKNGSRQKGQSAAAKSDYILREGKYASDRSEVAFSMSANIPEFAADEPRLFWEAADTYERANARLFREIELSLPRELDLPQQIGSMERFAQALGLGDLPYTMAIHRGNDTNPHCHLMFSERMNDGIERDEAQHFRRFNAKKPEQGGAQKTTEFRSKEWLQEARALWAEVANECLAEAGHDARIDHRSLIDQGIDRVPQIHLGPAAHAMEQHGIETERGDQLAEIMDANDALAVLAEYEHELQQEVTYERGRDYQEPQGPEGGSGRDHASDRGRGQRQEPKERGVSQVSQDNTNSDRRLGTENRPEHGRYGERTQKDPSEPSRDFEPDQRAREPDQQSDLHDFLERAQRRLNPHHNRDADRWYQLLTQLIDDQFDKQSRRDPARQKQPEDLRPAPAPEKRMPDQLEPVKTKPAAPTEREQTAAIRDEPDYSGQLGVRRVHKGRKHGRDNELEKVKRQLQEQKLEKAKAKLKDPSKLSEADAKSPEKIEDHQRKEDEIAAKQNDSTRQMKMGEEGYDAQKEETKNRIAGRPTGNEAPDPEAKGEEGMNATQKQIRKMLRELNKKAEALGAKKRDTHEASVKEPEPPKPAEQGQAGGPSK